MFFDRNGDPTDDANRDTSGTMRSFGAGDDYDPMYEGPGDAPKCAREWNDWRVCCCDDAGKFVGPGCRECNPPDHENKPYGWGIERFEDPALEAANQEMRTRRPQALYTSAGAYARTYWGRHRDGRMMMDDNARPVMRVTIDEPAFALDTEMRDVIWRAWSKWDRKLWGRSERLWDRLCDTCETHTEAKAKYEKWAQKRTGKPKGGAP